MKAVIPDNLGGDWVGVCRNSWLSSRCQFRPCHWHLAQLAHSLVRRKWLYRLFSPWSWNWNGNSITTWSHTYEQTPLQALLFHTSLGLGSKRMSTSVLHTRSQSIHDRYQAPLPRAITLVDYVGGFMVRSFTMNPTDNPLTIWVLLSLQFEALLYGKFSSR